MTATATAATDRVGRTPASGPAGARRSKVVLIASAVVGALWLGLSAPPVSPVEPGVPAGVQAPLTAQVDVGPDARVDDRGSREGRDRR
jgi:hypothetical protein